MSEKEKMVQVIHTPANGSGRKIIKKKGNIHNIFKLGSDRDKILDSHSWLDKRITDQILIHFFDEPNKKYFDMENLLKRMRFHQKLEFLKQLKLIDSNIYNDLEIISFCRNSFVHPPIIESVDELLSLEKMKTKKFKTIPKRISEIKDSEEFMKIYQKVCKYINKLIEDRYINWHLVYSKKMYDRLPEKLKKKIPFPSV